MGFRLMLWSLQESPTPMGAVLFSWTKEKCDGMLSARRMLDGTPVCSVASKVRGGEYLLRTPANTVHLV